MSAMMISITDKAVVEIRRIMTSDPAVKDAKDASVRVQVVGGGCSGMSYKLGFENQPPASNDKIFEKDGVRVLVDQKSFLYLQGTELDFSDGLNGTGFTFNNPNAKRTCGAVLASRLNPFMTIGSCPFCGKALGDGFLSRHVCPSCGKPLPSDQTETYFTALGVPENFHQDLALLQKRFYEVSRVLHPDRFTATDQDTKNHSLERMSLVNEAYRTLRSPVLLREYILELRGNKLDEKAKMPLELAESWFELQDALADEPATAEAKISAFEQELTTFRNQAEKEISAKEAAYDQSDSAEKKAGLLKELSLKNLELNYLKSMERDVERIKKK